MFDREIRLIGTEAFQAIQNTTVAIIGIGGVGGYALEALVRSGIKKIIICDYDTIDISNLNRQIITTQMNVGNKKVIEAKKRAIEINPNLDITCLDIFLNDDNIADLFQYHIDYIIDACDAINTKKRLIKEAVLRDINIISCMGTGNKRYPELLKIEDIRKTSYDPIAKILRKYIKTEHINKKIPVVYSTEVPNKKDNSHTIASIAYVPSVAGLLLASYVVNDIIDNAMKIKR